MSKNPEGATILLVDDEEDILDFLSYYLTKEGFEVITANNGDHALRVCMEQRPAAALVDVMMPGMDGYAVCRELKKNPETKDIIVALLTARSEDHSQITGFDAGADDYITKPVSPRVLVSRLKALLRRSSQKTEVNSALVFGGLVINRETFEVTSNKKKINFTKTEFELLDMLASRPGKVFSREEIYHKIWGENVVVGERTLDVHIRRLREKIGEKYIRTQKGVGYKFEH